MSATRNVDPKARTDREDSVLAAEKWADVAHLHPSGPTPAVRAYWDVELASGGLYRLFRDAASGDWFADGVYD